MTSWIFCKISHIREDVFKNLNGNHRKHVNIVIKTLFDDSYEKECHETLDTFWSEYTNFNHMNDPFDSKNKSGIVKISVMVIVIYGIMNTIYHLQRAWFCILQCNFKKIGIGSAEHSWGDVKTIKSGKRPSLGSESSDNQSIMSTSSFIEEERIGKNLSNTDGNDGSCSHSWNDNDHAFYYQLDQ